MNRIKVEVAAVLGLLAFKVVAFGVWALVMELACEWLMP